MKRHPQKLHVIPRRQHKTARAIVFSAIAIVILSVAGYLLVNGVFPKVPINALNTVDISASMSGFSPNVVHARVGEEVTLRLTSLDNQFHTDGGGQHQWAVDELGLNVVAPALGSESLTFTPAQPGTYTFYCDICCGGRANPTMQGTLIVEA